MDRIRFMRLWDLYGGLLTPTQREITDMYFNLDLTVSEIAQQKGVSRQSVSDCLNVCKRELEASEIKLGHEKLLAESDAHTSALIAGVEKWADDFLESHPQYLADIARLKDVFGEDNGVDAAEVLKKTGK